MVLFQPETLASPVIGYGAPDRLLDPTEVEAILAAGLRSLPIENKHTLVIVPDHTRTMPLPLFFRLLAKELSGRATKLDYLVALGTHPPMPEDDIRHMLGISAEQHAGAYRHIHLFNHAWNNPDALTTLGVIPASEVEQISNGLLSVDIPVRMNRMVLDYEYILVCGPVFPHEVVGFSGGNKYFFPGIAGREIIDITHWLGALITSYSMIGVKDTPVRQVINRAATMIPTPRSALCSVVTTKGVHGLFVGAPEDAYSAAADLSAQIHVHYVDRPFKQVLSVLPEMYDEMWVGAKGMYKLEPVIADGGELIIYAPHIHEFSRVHGQIIRQIGFHVRDYFAKQWDRFKDVPWGVLAHSTHVRGIGDYDVETGVERPRVQVTLATGISEADCRAVGLGYRDPASINPADFANREHEGVLLVPHAGEVLYRLKS